MRRALLGMILAVLWLLVAWQRPVAWAHGTLVDSSIAPGSLIAALPATLTLGFSEDLDPSLCSLHVSGPNGAGATNGGPFVYRDGRTLRIALRAQGDGTYTVSWTTVSAEDGQVVTGAFRFAVAYASHAGDLQARLQGHAAGALGVTSLVAAVTYWLLLAIAVLWAGGALFEMPPGTVGTRPAVSSEDGWITAIASQSHTLRYRLLEVLLGLLVFSWLLEAAHLALAGRVSLIGGIIDLFGGHLGALRLLAFVVVAAALADLRRSAAAPPVTPVGAHTPARARLISRLGTVSQRMPILGRWGQLLCAALFLLSLAASGHAGGMPGITISTIVLAWLHSMAAAAWIGGMAYLALMALPVTENLDLDRRAPMMLGLLRRLIPFAVAGMATLAVSGLFAAQVEVGSRQRLLGNAYGDALSVKLLVTLAVCGLTIYLLSVQRSRLERIWTQRQRLECLHELGGIGRMLRLGVLLGAAILATTTTLWSSIPAATVPLSATSRLPSLPSNSWHPAGLSGKAVYRLLFDPRDRHTLWAATNAGVWRSTDDQQSWTLRGHALAHLAVYDVLFLDGGGGLLVAAADGHLYRTYDAGAHWQRLGHPFGSHPLRALAANGRVQVAGGDDGLFRSVDDSSHWHSVPRAPRDIGALYWSQHTGQFLAGTRRTPWQIYSAGAGGASWQLLFSASAQTTGVRALLQLGTRTLGGAGDGVWASDSTGTWRHLTSGLARGTMVDAFLGDDRTPGRVYLGTPGGFYGSVDGGTSWAPLGRDAPPSVLCLAMRPGPIRILYAGTAGGVYKFTVGA